MKKLAICLTALLMTLLLTSCSGVKYKDGVYSAQLPEFAASGWKEMVEVTIENGKIEKIDWDAAYKDESIPIKKKQYSKSGLYGMMVGGASAEWYDQATAAQQFVLEHGIDALEVSDDGYTDAVAGCTIHVTALDELVRECLKQAEK